MRKLTTKQFIEKAIKNHGDKYRYDKVFYINNRTKVQIYCKKCKKYFLQIPNSHLNGWGCRLCCKSKKLTTNEFINKSKKNHGDKYRYDKVFYINNRTKVQIYCKKCKKYFLQIPNSHLNGKGCSACFNWNRTTTDFIKESKLINGDKYGYDKSTYINSRTKVEIYCKYHKTYFKQTPHAHLSGQGCPICSESKGEKEIRIFLEKYNIQHVIQKRFDDCKNKRALPFDVYLPDYNICIEYQGQQHYQLIEYIGKKILNIEESKKLFKKQQKRDKIKRDYCKINNIPLLEIPYWNMKNIDTILTAFINTCN